MISPISASNLTNTKQPSFGRLTPVSYVVVDGHTVVDKKIIDDVTKDFIKQIRKCLPKDKSLREALFKATGETSALSELTQHIKKFGDYIITGQDVVDLKKIWSLAKVSYEQKANKASAFIKKLYANMNPKKLAIVAERVIEKGKEKYLIKDLYTTIY